MRLVCVSRRKADKFPQAYRELRGDPDLNPGLWRDGMENWVVQTALRLHGQDPGIEVVLSDHFIPGAITLVHRDEASPWLRPASCFTIVARADRAPVFAADRVVVQNPLQEGPNNVYIPHWPQPGLIPRDSDRGDQLRVLAYQGRVENLPDAFHDPAFSTALHDRGIELRIKADGWHDYHDVDAVFAVRRDHTNMIASKPASKLVNAWLAGAVPILGCEPAYRASGRAGVDFLEADDPAAVVAAVDRLQREPARFASLIAAGSEQRGLYSVTAVTARWLDALRGPLAPRGPSSWLGRCWQQRAAAWREHRAKRAWRQS